ncbi:MAG: TonB-dependent receptor [Acidobacteria bacterium]|nr:TonB-dependent receptor [Acidobacteriota bacterium]
MPGAHRLRQSSRNSQCRFAGLFLFTLLAFKTSAQPGITVSGVVEDSSGARIAGAEVTLSSPVESRTVRADFEGRFVFPVAAGSSGKIRALANGFSPVEESWSAAEPLHLRLVLGAAQEGERIVVSASRSELKLSQVPGSAVELARDDLNANPALTTDDLLRQVPGFSLFRRSSSRVANPTTLGASLRGLGGSGPSRALVLEDGVPLVDPFGGWVHWDQIARAELSSVEVFRGGESNLYGNDAMGGVVQFVTRVPTAPVFSADLSYGSENTPDLSAWAGTAISRWDFEAGADMSRTSGYILVPASERGLVDTAANSRHATLDGGLGYRISDTGRAFLRGSLFDESRNNGTPLQTNSTSIGAGVAGINREVGDHDSVMARVFGQAEGYDQTFSSIAADRSREALTDRQHVPSQQLGGALQWNHALGRHSLIGGADLAEVMGTSDEQIFSSLTGAQVASTIAGGRQRSAGLFGEDIFRLGTRWTILAGVRWDDWNNFDASNVRVSLPSGMAAAQAFPGRSETSFSPRLSIMRNLRGSLAVWLSGYRAFRAPTLNELYRSFRLGGIVTNANPQLRAEHLTGAETGARASAFNQRAEFRGTIFWADVVNPVTNVTLSTTPALITRERQNLGRARSLGTELDAVWHVRGALEFSTGYQFVHAYVADSKSTLAGKLVPEVPKHQLTWEARYWEPRRIELSIEGRYSSSQWDDDLNTLFLRRYYIMDLFAGREFARGLVAYVAVENLLNQRYAFQISPPVEQLASPILGRIGIRYDFSRK